ncbi:phosphoenolpyruvate-protein phosphotransferase [Salinarchaeum sp. Harcht-Bsk1]|uniref:phosphoenolpyruvate--protein phosphotransferase n=1 Tax=Salinarchaeum sp. Harcht-Bsk1 TaxID=1333523 RepID=UPI000342374F|nr:phosphoenolpyruvate--protein phosphotransferase [Salinarchaeum sp. Harcht-Bsk1]AGN02045.1 phosphoenolpyruvate-protein phosphotransferase [Salinarchaeum sp. Harcht-Bsk1]
MTRTFEGVGATPLSGVGTARWSDPPLPEFEHESDDPERERERFEDARDAARAAIQTERERAAEHLGEEEAGILDAHRQFLDDPQIESSVETAIEAGHTAEAAVETAFDDPIEQYEESGGRLAERADDLRDVRDRLLRTLADVDAVDLSALPEGTVLLAERLAPSDAARLDPDRVAGLATVVGGRTAHAAIVARALGIPAVVGVGDDLREVEDGEQLVVDGDVGTVVVDADEATLTAAKRGREVDVIAEPVETADGHPIEVAANVGRPVELEGAVANGADGVGLYRTEFLYVDRSTPPDEDEQFEAYRNALDAFPDRRIVIRTADVGGDKPIPYLDLPEEPNPFLGVRGVRRSLGPDGDLFETQLRALLRAAGDAAAGDGSPNDAASDESTGALAVMFPMVTELRELEAVLERIAAVEDDLGDAGEPVARPELGVMIETPAAVRMAPELAEHLDFLSIGTNDLTQYVMAADRDNEQVASLHDPLHPPVVRAIRATIEGGHENDAWVGMCGEMAGDPSVTELLLGLGLDEFSASAVTIPQVKAKVQQTTLEDAEALAERVLDAATREEVQAILDGEG